jgi:large subunit ribosomal protein L21
MYAIVEIAGQQFKVERDRKIYVHRLDASEGDSLVLDRVMLVDDEGNVQIGMPLVEGATITAEVLQHCRGNKVIVFKKKRRKSYQKRTGHRQDFTRILIKDILLN